MYVFDSSTGKNGHRYVGKEPGTDRNRHHIKTLKNKVKLKKKNANGTN
jgi:hypothetical protein